MIGGVAAAAFITNKANKLDQKLVVRSCQIHPMMPMIQFSVAPWRILDEEHLAICLKYAKLNEALGDYIVEGFESCIDQYMLGDKYLVAPVMDDTFSRSVTLPKGTWADKNGKVYRGGRTYTLDVPLDRLPYFTKKSK